MKKDSTNYMAISLGLPVVSVIVASICTAIDYYSRDSGIFHTSDVFAIFNDLFETTGITIITIIVLGLLISSAYALFKYMSVPNY